MICEKLLRLAVASGDCGVTGLSEDQWSRAKELFDQALDWPVAERAARVTAAMPDPAVLAEVASLLASADQTRGFFDRAPSSQGIEALADLSPGSRIGSWRIVRTIGHGGMGVVYEAARAEGGFDQRAALKIIDVEASAYLTRFEDERAIVARLEHPGIARLYDGGIDADGHPYMAMEFVDGAPITAHVSALPLRRRLELFVAVCDAVAYAHRNLVVHLDIKPSNVLVTRDGTPRLLDFGAARVLEAGLPDGAAAAMLTPAYAAPEQRAGQTVTTATDVFALGVLLRELAAGTNAAMPRDIEAMVTHATLADPALRYANAGALAADVRRHLRGEPIAIRSGSRLYVAGRALRRYRWAAAAAALMIVSLGAGLTGTAIEARRAIAERDHFEAEVARGDAAMDYFALMFRTADAGSDGQPVTAQAVLADSAANLDRDFAGQPAKYGRVVEFLANLYSELTDETGGVALERRYLASPAAAGDPATASRVRVMLAQSLLRQGDADGATRILGQAQAYWNRDPARFAGELARSRIIEGQLRKAGGDLPAAIAALRRGLAEAATSSAGVPPEDVSNLRNSLSLALMADGSFTEAKALMADVRAFREAQGRTDDNLFTAIQNQGAIALAMGDYKGAESLLRQSIGRRRARLGPSGAMAAADLNLARALLLQNRPADAAAPAAEGARAALSFTGPSSPLSIAGKVMVAAATVEQRGAESEATTAAALAATAAKPDALHALALAVKGRLLADQSKPGSAAAILQGRAMLTAAGKPGLLAQPLFAQISGQAAISR